MSGSITPGMSGHQEIYSTFDEGKTQITIGINECVVSPHVISYKQQLLVQKINQLTVESRRILIDLLNNHHAGLPGIQKIQNAYTSVELLLETKGVTALILNKNLNIRGENCFLEILPTQMRTYATVFIDENKLEIVASNTYTDVFFLLIATISKLNLAERAKLLKIFSEEKGAILNRAILNPDRECASQCEVLEECALKIGMQSSNKELKKACYRTIKRKEMKFLDDCEIGVKHRCDESSLGNPSKVSEYEEERDKELLEIYQKKVKILTKYK